MSRTLAARGGGAYDYFCECANVDCTFRITLSRTEYERGAERSEAVRRPAGPLHARDRGSRRPSTRRTGSCASRAKRASTSRSSTPARATRHSVPSPLVSHATADAVSWWERARSRDDGLRVAYFSMEFGLHERLPIYSGGLGVLAGDHLKAAAELGRPARRRRPPLPRRLLPPGHRHQPVGRPRTTSRSIPRPRGSCASPSRSRSTSAARAIEAAVWRKDVGGRSRSTCSRSTGSPTRSTAAIASTGSARSSSSASAASERSPHSGSSRPSST